MNLDHKISHALFHAARHNWLARHAAIFFATHLIWFMIGVLVATASVTSAGSVDFFDGDVLIMAVLIGCAWGATMLLSSLVRRRRPYLELGVEPLIAPFVHTASFPSAHATIAFSMLFFALDIPDLWPFMLTAAILVALGRVASGVHFFSDVIVGGLIGYYVTQASSIAFMLLLMTTK